MHKILYLFVILTLSSLFSSTAQAAALPIPKAPSTGAKAFVIQDFNSGRIIADENADMPVEPASITKMMTAHIVFGELQAGNLA